jgi:tetratricopeptide (TPR) repeat protein
VTLSLQALSSTETAQLVHALLEQPVLDADLQWQLVERAEGNPLYAEEFARLVAEGRRPEQLPESVQGIVGARLDALTQDEKQRLQDAAVVGKVFWLGAVATIAGAEPWSVEEVLHSLERKEFVRRERRSTVEGETEYAFGHLVVRDVAYGQIPRAARVEKHRAMAEWLDGVGRAEDHAEMLAHHYIAALELGRASALDLSAVAQPAFRALREAGDRAHALNAFPASARFYGEAIALVEEPEPELLFRRAEALHHIDDAGSETEHALEEARDALLAVGGERAAEAEALLAEVWWNRGEQEACLGHLARGEELVRHSPATAAKARVLSQVARYRAIAGQLEPAIRAGEEALAISEQLGLDALRAQALNNIAIAKMHEGDTTPAISLLEQSIEIATSVNSPDAGRGYNNLSVAVAFAGDMRKALELREESVRVAERYGDMGTARFSRGSLILHLYTDGRWDDALTLIEAELGAGEGAHVVNNFARRARASIRHARGDDRGAHDDIGLALEIARRARDPQAILPTLSIALRIAVELERQDEVAALAGELVREIADWQYGPPELVLGDALLVARPSGIFEDVRGVLEGLPRDRPWADAGWAILERRFDAGADALYEIGDVANAAYLRLLAAEQLAEDGRRAEAEGQLQKALAFYRSVGATRYIRRGEALLAASA